MEKTLKIVGGGLAGSEAAYQAAKRGVPVDLFEMRPHVTTGAHTTGKLAELVCSNSLGSKLHDRATGLLKEELSRFGSLLVDTAESSQVPAGGALAVDRELFSQRVTLALENHPLVNIIRQEVTSIPEGVCILASGPLTSRALSRELVLLAGEKNLYFYDALAPIVDAASIDMSIAYRASRYGRGEQERGDYINCPLNKEEYTAFLEALIKADRITLKGFEQEIETGVHTPGNVYFEGCLPVEIIATRGEKSLAYGPMRPVGLDDPRTGRWPYAVLQLRQDNAAGTLYNLVGFQTNLTYQEQDRVFRMIPGLKNAEFIRYGQMHRNTFINSPNLLSGTLQFRSRVDLFIAGQLSGVEGYMGNIATGLVAGINAARLIKGEALISMPNETMLGSLLRYITEAEGGQFQPMKANFGLVPAFTDREKRNKRQRAAAYADRSLRMLDQYLDENNI
ncbi:MAG: methylenetetrahydrofolate--tRNA-(uracil(54)-C(5))-methyltransferase (FADH(2)-oxidizing) TrmFO [Anaerolineales bacterium]|nr:methylenetetrahydrofolate--tRNA-(uracil(54)-C(5))-methyltransferase (FADH(2)-oxidizing) TrmFO [Anaerolineales bacterium]